MPKQINYQLSAEELIQIQRAIAREQRVNVRQRAAAIHLLHQGKKPEEIASTLAVSVGSIYKWHRRWRKRGLDGLANQPRSGAPPKAGASYWRRLGEVLALGPHALGYSFPRWTARWLVAHMAQETGVRLSKSRLRMVMKQLGYRYRHAGRELLE